jgi:CheY-like chemotaxis protein
VENGRLAVEAWSVTDPDIILMDIQMPEMDGVAAARAIRAAEIAGGRPRTPILAVTANAMAHQVDEYVAAGMDGLVSKPIEIAKLQAALEQAIAAKETASRAAA